MAVIREHLVIGGEIVEQGAGMGGDDEGAPPEPLPGMRVHKDGEIDGASGTPDLSEIEANAAKIRAAKPKPAKAPKAAGPGKAPSTDSVSDRRRCLELAANSGASGVDEILSAAQRFKEFLEEE